MRFAPSRAPVPWWDRILIGTSYLYLVIPIVVFFIGWLRPGWGLIASAVVVAGLVTTLARFEYREPGKSCGPGFLFVALLISLGWALLSGIDGFGFQNSDFPARNAVFRDLIQNSWPVLYDYHAYPASQAMFGDTGALVYYFAYWLPSALVGKLLGWKVANHVLLLWTVLGVFLTFVLTNRFVGIRSACLMLAFVGWGGMDLVGTMLYRPIPALAALATGGVTPFRLIIGQTLAMALGQQHLEGWASPNGPISLWQYSSFTTQLFWVFNQAVPAWIVTGLLMNLRGGKSLLYTYCLALLFAPLPAVGLLPFVVFRLIEKARPGETANGGKGKAGNLWSQALSFENTVPPAILGLVAISFLGTQHAVPTQGFVWQLFPISADLAFRYIAFCVLEFGAFGLLVMRRNEDLRLLLLAMGVLLVLPLFVYGQFNDLVMRASIPALLVLFMVGFKNLFADLPAVSADARLLRLLLIAVLLIGIITPLHEINRSAAAIVKSQGEPPTEDSWITFGGNHNLEEAGAQFAQYVLSRPEDTFFFRVLAK